MTKQLSLVKLLALLALVVGALTLPQTVLAAEPPPSPGDDAAGWKTEAVAVEFQAMDFSSPNDGWALANRSYDAYLNQASLYHYDGQRWRWTQTFPGDMDLWDVSAVSPTDAWLLGNTLDDNANNISHLYHYDGAVWQAVAAPADALYGIEMLSAQVGFGSGEKHLWRYDGATWTAIADSPPNAYLTGPDNHFQALDEQNLWLSDRSSVISGDPNELNGDVYKFSDGAWQSTLPHTTVSSLSIVSPTLGWAGGSTGAIWRYDGSTWQPFTPVPNPYPLPTSYSVEGIAGLADKPQDVWAVIPAGVYHYDGADWQAQPMPLLYSSLLVMWSADEGWLGPATHYTGGEWQSSLSLIDPVIFPEDYGHSFQPGVFTLNANSVWYSTFRFDGSTWQTVPYTVTDELIAPFVEQPASFAVRTVELTKIKMIDSANGWAIGDISLQDTNYYRISLNGLLFRYGSGVWTPIATPDSAVDNYFAALSDFDVVDRNTVWVLGSNSAIHRYANGQWQTVYPPREMSADEPYYNALVMLSANEGWAAGNAFLRYDGQDWQVTQAISHTINAMSMVSPQDGWAVGERGVIYHYDGQSWQQVVSPTPIDLYDVAVPGSDTGWAIGYTWGGGPNQEPHALLLHYDGAVWQTAAILPQMRLWSISMSDAENGRIAGSEQLLLRLGEPGFQLYLPHVIH